MSDLDAAVAAFEHSLEADQLSPRLTLAVLTNLSLALQTRYSLTGGVGDLDRAVAQLSRALTYLASDTAIQANAISNLGSLLIDRYSSTSSETDLEQAIALLQRALRLLPQGSSETPALLSNLGMAMQLRYGTTGELADLNQAVEAYKRSLEALSLHSAHTPAVLSNYGSALRELYSRTGDEAVLQRAVVVLKTAVRALPAHDPATAASMHNLGTLMLDRKDYKSAERYLKQALAVREAVLGSDHPDTAASRLNLARLEEERGAEAEARMHLERALTAYERRLGPDHPKTAQVRVRVRGTHRRVAVLTAIAAEFDAVCTFLAERQEVVHPSGTVYERGIFSSGTDTWDVLVAEIGAGNVAAASEAERVIQFFRPEVAIFIGIAGGLKDVRIGDVVAATKVYGYHSGKAAAAFEPRPDVGQSSYQLEQRARATARRDDWLRHLGEHPPDPPPLALVGPIVAGEQVVSSLQSATYQFLRAQYGDALAVEMEGRGFLSAIRASQGVHGLVVRGISDLLERKAESEEQGSQRRAALHASAFAFEVLSGFRLDASRETASADRARLVWNVPEQLARNPSFAGREAELATLRRTLTDQRNAVVTQAITGLGGVGKTQLAVEYVYRYMSEYEVIWWIRAEDSGILAADYVALARTLSLPIEAGSDQDDKVDVVPSTNQDAQIEAVRSWLEAHTQWLLVFDNAIDYASIRSFLPAGGSGHVLVTSRNRTIWRPFASSISLEVWRREDSVRFLTARTGQDDEESARAIADAVGDLPLALEQAAAYVEFTGMSLSDYVQFFEQSQSDALSRGQPATNYRDTVAGTWNLSFRAVSDASPAAADLLRLLSFIAPNAIPISLIHDGATHLPDPLRAAVADTAALNDVVGLLRSVSLVERVGGMMSMHRLVQAVTRDALDSDARGGWAAAAVTLLDAAFPTDAYDVQTWTTCELLLPHGLAATAAAERLGVAIDVQEKIRDSGQA